MPAWNEPLATALLTLADGTVIEGQGIGATGKAVGEVCFNTAMTGYEEILTDPSYAGQIITFTYPHIGNYGVTGDDDESHRPFCRGVVVRDLARRHSNWRAAGDLDSFLRHHGVPGIGGVITGKALYEGRFTVAEGVAALVALTNDAEASS